MKIEKIDYSEIEAISHKDLSYIQLDPYLRKFYSYTPSLDSFAKAILDRQKYEVDRSLLTNVLQQRYAQIEITKEQATNLDSLINKNTFTIVTAHQPSLFGGPLYYVLKIASVINLTRQLNLKYPEYHFVPTFISGGEDHDFEEIDHLHLFGNTLKWNRESYGAVGRLSLDGLDGVLDEVTKILGDQPMAKSLSAIFSKALASSKTYGDFVFKWVNLLFGQYGLIVVNMDDKTLKRRFAPIMRQELEKSLSKSLVTSTQEELESHKFKAQAFPRDINLFYFSNHGRNRIEKANNGYEIVDTDLFFSFEELHKELEDHPENFSPNVVMRPLYQEYILPNLAYIGGGGEIAYWLERKSQFAAFDIFFPMLIRRNSALLLNNGILKNMSKLGFSTVDLFMSKDQLIHKYISENSEVEIDLILQKQAIEAAYQTIANKSAKVDPTLSKSVLAEMTKQLKNIDQMESRIKRSLKSKEEVQVNKIEKLKEKLFPNNGLQERYDNFLSHHLDFGELFLDNLVKHLDPMDRRFYCISQ